MPNKVTEIRCGFLMSEGIHEYLLSQQPHVLVLLAEL